MKRITYILLMALGMAVAAPAVSVLDSSVAAVYAVDARAKAKAQREKEKAKKAKEREKAKAKAAKEREKAAAQRKKEQAKATAQKQKEQQTRQQAKAKQQQSKAKSQTAANKAKSAKPAQPALTAAEEKAQYMAAVAAIDKSNAKANAYNNRDIAHRLGFWGLVGYSKLFTSGITYQPASQTQPNAFGFELKDKGFVGGGAGLGYQLRYKQFIFTTGVEFTLYNTVQNLSGSDNGDIYRTFEMKPYNSMHYTYDFSGVSEKILGGFAQVPILFGMEHKNVPLFWQAGVKVGYGLFSRSTLKGDLTTTIKDDELIAGLTDMYKHTLVNNEKIDRPANSVNFGLNVAATAEIGINFDQWINSKARVRLSVFADYGVLNALSYKAADGAQDLPMQLPVGKAGVSPLDYTVNASYATTAAKDVKVNPFLVGAKIAVWFDLPRKQKATQEYPKAPTPRMGVYMYDDSSDKALGGVAVEIINMETGKKLQKNTNRQGLLQGRFAPGEYRVSATKNGYYPSDTILKKVEVFDFDTLRLPLQRIPAPVIPMLCMNVYDVLTNEPIEALARITALNDTAVLYAAQSADDGFIETTLTEGTYVAHMSAVGYMPKDDTLRFVLDTLDVFMQPIKEGIKVKIENLFFATNKTYILPQSEQAMSDLANFLLDNPSVKIHVVGHTDAVGTDEANQILSEGRANSVRNDLINRGVAAERITAEGKGEKEPVADNDTEEGRQLNRRVEFTITDVGDEDIQQIY
jgi:outer membrane protein OmpA-like peptidoglycan-associated protein